MHTHTFELLLYHAEDKRLGINFKSIVNADAFFAEYYRLQSCLDSLSFDNTPFCNLTIDMSSVEYFDALSLSTFFVDLKNTAGLEEIKILLIDQMRMESPEEASLCRDFRRFFINFGFFDALQDIPGCKTEPKPDSELVREYAWHDNGCVVPFCFLTPGGLPIDDLRNALYRCSKDALLPIQQERFISKVLFFIQETASNAFEHGYNGNADKCCALLIDFAVELKDSVAKEVGGHPVYQPRDLEFSLKKVLRVYVVDTGAGLLSNLSEEARQKEGDRFLLSVFMEGIRSKHKRKISKFGGLYTIYNHMCESRDALGVKADQNWYFSSCPLKKGDEYRAFRYITDDGKGSEVLAHGFSIVGYYGIAKHYQPEYNDLPEKNVNTGLTRDVFDVSEEQFENILSQAEAYDMRISIEHPPTDFSKPYVILPDADMEKSKIGDIFKSFNVRVRVHRIEPTCIIADVPQGELRKYQEILNGSKLSTARAILISDQMVPFVYLRERNGELKYSADATVLFRSPTSVDEIIASPSPDANIYSFYRWKKCHDSLMLWKLIAEEKKRNKTLLIHGPVKWGTGDDKEPRIIDGYLDFTQLCRVEECNLLCRRQLVHLCGLLGCGHYFVEADRFTQELCQQVNNQMELPRSESGDVIFIGSVFVTGLSSTVKKMSKSALGRFHYFIHGSGDDAARSESGGVPLLYWMPKAQREKILDLSAEGEGDYCRVGRTSYVAKIGGHYFASKHYLRADGSQMPLVDLSHTIELFQTGHGNLSNILRMGHHSYSDRHDFLFISIYDLFSAGRYKGLRVSSEWFTSFDFMLFECYNALILRTDITEKTAGKYFSEDFDGAILNRIGTENMREKFKLYAGKYLRQDKNTRKPGETGLLVWLYDYSSEKIVSEIQKFFSHKRKEQIVSLSPIVPGRIASPLLISPLLLDELEQKIKEHPMVTVFLIAASSARLQFELEHILLQLGSACVRFVSLLEQLNYPLGSMKIRNHRFFMRSCFPSLGSENACPLCQGLRNACNMRDKLFSETLKERINEIERRWKPMHISGNYLRHGIADEVIELPIGLQDKIDEWARSYGSGDVKIDTRLGFVMFVVESMVISLDPELFLTACDCDGLEQAVKLLLLTSYMLLFGSLELTPKLKREIILRLFRELKSYRNTDEYSAVAFLTIAGADLQLFAEEFEDIIKHYVEGDIGENYDYFLALLYIVHERNPGNTSIAEGEPDLRPLEFFFEPSGDIVRLLYGIFSITVTENPRTHSTALARLGQEIISSYSQYQLEELMSSCGYLKSAYCKLPPTTFGESTDALREDITELEAIVPQLQPDNPDLTNTYEAAKQKAADIIKKAEKINENLYIMCGTKGVHKLEHKLASLANEHGMSVIMKNNRANTPRDRWIYWYFDIETEIKASVMDFKHAEDFLYGQYEGCILFDFSDSNFLSIKLFNILPDNQDFEKLLRLKDLKNRPTKLVLQEFGHFLAVAFKKDELAENPSYALCSWGEVSSILSEDIARGGTLPIKNKQVLRTTFRIPYADAAYGE